MMPDGQDAAPGGSEIVSTRVFAAPRERVWRAFADPALLGQWWGPRGFTNTFHKFDFRAGGRWMFEMHGPDGTHYEQTREFVEVAAPERIIMDNPNPVHRFRMTIELTPHRGATQLVWRMAFESAAEFVRVKTIIVTANEEVFDRLEAVLRDMA